MNTRPGSRNGDEYVWRKIGCIVHLKKRMIEYIRVIAGVESMLKFELLWTGGLELMSFRR